MDDGSVKVCIFIGERIFFFERIELIFSQYVWPKIFLLEEY
jgi:hypothetical protein